MDSIFKKSKKSLFSAPGLAIIATLAAGAACNSPSNDSGSNGGGNYTPPGSSIPPVAFSANPVNLSAAWANDGGDKVVREDTRASKNADSAQNSVWKNSKINLFGAKNEVIGFNMILEAATNPASNVTITFDRLTGPGGATISSTPTTGDGVYDWTKRDIELFYVQYLQVKGLSRLGYEVYDERHVPAALQRPWTGQGAASGSWSDRPNHDKSYPDIAVPYESVGKFNIAKGQNQSVWSDIYIPADAVSGIYEGSVQVSENGQPSYTLPVELTVRNFALPDVPNSKTMLDLGYSDIANRYIGTTSPSSAADIAKVRTIRDRHYLIAHRHKISLIDGNEGTRSRGTDAPSDEWIPRLDGTLFTQASGYRGPGTSTGNNVFSIGTYGAASWQTNASTLVSNATNWSTWFAANSPQTQYFLYLADESSNYTQIQGWANTLNTSSGASRNLASFATMPLPSAETNVPGLDVVSSTIDVGDTATWDNALAKLHQDPNKHFFMYNGKRPATGTFMTDDDGVALREKAWGQYKKGIERWFYWESTYYNDYQSGRGQTNVWSNAQTFGPSPSSNSVMGMTSGNYANGDGVLFYPGTDKTYPGNSLGLNGPIASLRLKHWRRGIQDVDYITLANQYNPAKVQQIVNQMVPKVLWENGVDTTSDPTYKHCPIGWSVNPDDWESARAQLAEIIENHG